jgi:hypothetical protein
MSRRARFAAVWMVTFIVSTAAVRTLVADDVSCATAAPQIERGRAMPVLDAVGWVIGIPGKIVLWNSRVNNHHISADSEAKLREFVACRNLGETKIRLNQYAPLDEWRRLRQNKEVGAGWRYTFGVWHTLGYTVFPGRIWGGDWYNPYTNSIYLHSDVASLAMAQAAYADDVRNRKRPGTYSFTQEFAGLDMWHETIATKSTIAYVQQYGTADELREAYNVLYPRYGLRTGQSIDSYVGFAPIFGLGGAIVGHTAGRYASSRVEESRPTEIAPPPPPTIDAEVIQPASFIQP